MVSAKISASVAEDVFCREKGFGVSDFDVFTAHGRFDIRRRMMTVVTAMRVLLVLAVA